MVALLPITSMPLVVNLVGSNAVAAPSGLLLLALVFLWLIPYLLHGGSFPLQTIPFLLFCLAAVASTALSFFWGAPPRKFADPLFTSLSALLTLGIGASFYLSAAAWPVTEEKMRLTLKVINWSGLVVILWTLTQAGAWYMFHRYPDWMRTVHGFYSVGTLFRQRFVGFALEPSWLAHQLNMLYLPWWLAASVKSFSVHRWRIGKFSFENILLAFGSLILAMTLSRVGLGVFLLMIGFLALRKALSFSRWLQTKAASMLKTQGKSSLSRFGIDILVLGGLAVVFLVLILVVGFALSRLDQRMATLFQLDFLEQDNPINYLADKLSLAARLVYWKSGWLVFNDHPWFGVGLGSAGYYLPDYLDGFAWRLSEVRTIIFRSGELLNTKNIWIRILAETGMVGFSFFLCWLYINWTTARAMEENSHCLPAVLGTMAILMLIGLPMEGFSLDTFALPYIWFSLGLMLAAWKISRNRLSNFAIEEPKK